MHSSDFFCTLQNVFHLTLQCLITVKLVFNKVTNKNAKIYSQRYGLQHKCSRLKRSDFHDPTEFVKTEFDCV